MPPRQDAEAAEAATRATTMAKADKELDLSLKIVPHLKDVEFHVWSAALLRVAFQNDWEDYILDTTAEVPDSDDWTVKDRCDIRNAFMVITATCVGHQIEDKLTTACTMGDAHHAYKLVHQHFHRPTATGRQTAIANLYSISMAKTDTNLAQYLALARRNAKVVKFNGTDVSDVDVLACILAGLLPEFKPIKLIIEQDNSTTLDTASSRLEDWAASEGIVNLTKGGNVNKRDKTFTVRDDSNRYLKKRPGKESSERDWVWGPGGFYRKGVPWVGSKDDCQRYHRNECKSNSCRFVHPPAGATPASAAAHVAIGTTTKSQCHFCGDENHFMSTCPLLPKKVQATSQYIQEGEGEANYLFTAATKQEEPTRSKYWQLLTWPTMFLLTLLLGACYFMFFHVPSSLFSILKNNKANILVLMLLAILAHHHISAQETGVSNGSREDGCWIEEERSNEANRLSPILNKRTCLVEAVPGPSHHPSSLYSNAKAADGLNGPHDELHNITRKLHNPLDAGILLTSNWMIFQRFLSPFPSFYNNVVAAFYSSIEWLHAGLQASASRFDKVTASVRSSITWPCIHSVKQVEIADHLYIAGHRRQSPGYEWCCDTGTNRFITNDRGDFVPGTEVKHNTVVATGSGNVTSTVSGTVIVKSLDHGCTIKCENVLYLPTCPQKLMPISTFVRKGCQLHMENYDEVTLLSKGGSPILSGKEFGGLYLYRCKTVSNTSETNETYFGLPAGQSANSTSQDFGQRLLEAHWAYGHLHFTKLRKLLGLAKGDDPDCASCTIAMSRKSALSKEKYTRSTRINHRKHLDIGFTKNCNYCFQLVIDDYTREGFLDVLKSKDEAFASFLTLQRQHDNDHAPYKLAVLRCDSEPLYTAPAWETMCDQNGVAREFSSRHRHDQNGVVERAMQGIGVGFRCMMIHGNAPEADIPDALRFSNVVRNNSPTKANNGWTPREKRMGKRLPVNKRLLQGVIFCLVFAHVYEEERSKHAPRGIACIYLGYDPIDNAYKVKEWLSGKVYYTADVTFHPRTMPYRANPTRLPRLLTNFDDMAPHVLTPSGDQQDQQPQVRRSTRVTLPSDQALRNVKDVDTAPSSTNSLYADFSSFFVHNFGPDPTTWKEALGSRYSNEWILARLDEQNSFKYHGVFSYVPRSAAQGKRIFNPRPVMKIKVNPPSLQHPNGSIEKFKYRLTIAAFTKMLIQGVDYKEKYASTVQWDSVKVMFAIACFMDYDIALSDISTFFLYGKLLKSDPDVFMEQADGWDSADYPKEDFICKLNRSMYGLPQAPRCAQLELKACLVNNGFKSCAADDCIYVGPKQDTEYAAIGAHVDDLFSIGTAAGLNKIEQALSSKFKITVKRNPDVVTGVQIQRDRKARWLKLHQTAYATDLLKNYGMDDCKEADTPIDPGTAKALMLLPSDKTDLKSLKEFQKLVGELMWLRKTRPDLQFLLSLLCRFLKNATHQHLVIARGRPLRFLKKTVSYGVAFYPGPGEWILSGASDSDLAGDLTTARSTMGYYACLGQFGAVLSGCTLERKICTSVGQAETYAMLILMKSIVWLRTLLSELGFPQQGPTPLAVDNDGVRQQSTNSINHSAAKHYRIAQSYIRQKVDDKVAVCNRVDSDLNPSDIYTKALYALLFLRHQGVIMGPQSPPAPPK
jgi:hypothetical protein